MISLACAGMQIAGGLVRQNQLGITCDCARHAHQLLLSAGKLVGIEIFLADNLKAIEDIRHHGCTLRPRDIAVRKRDIDIFLHGRLSSR